MKNEVEKIFCDKFLNNCAPEEKYFLEQIKDYQNYHEQKATINKDKYFGNNKNMIKSQYIKNILKSVGAILTSIVSAVGTTAVLKKISEILKVSLENQILAFIFIMAIVLVVIMIFYLDFPEKKRKELKLRRYGETWVRHSIAISKYEKEIMEYTYGLGDYNGKSEKIQRQIFMERILQLESENIKKFEKNMEKTKEVIE